MFDFEKSKITESEKEKHRISNLSDRPNAFSSYRQSKMNADDVKKAFDAQMDFLARKHNELVEGQGSLSELYGDLDGNIEALRALMSQVSSTQVVMWKGDIANLVDEIYPVGAVYISSTLISPAYKFGGEWKRIEDRFLLGAGDTYAAGDTGGAATHTLTTAEMPEHAGHLYENDKYPWGKGNAAGKYLHSDLFYTYEGAGRGWNTTGGEMTPAATNRGGGQPHNNMPPYLAVYMWERIR